MLITLDSRRCASFGKVGTFLIEQLGAGMAKPSVKLNLATVRQLLDYLVTGGILPSNPAGTVPGP
jgi:site-specific recombinase XerC